MSSIDDNFSVFKTEKKGYGSDINEHSLHLFSASTSEWVHFILAWYETSVPLDSFPGESCTFEVKKETDGRILTYNVDKGEGCYSKPEENHQISSEFTYNFVDDQNRDYNQYSFELNSFEFDINEFINRTDSRLIINNEKMTKKSFDLTNVYYSMFIVSMDAKISYTWQIY